MTKSWVGKGGLRVAIFVLKDNNVKCCKNIVNTDVFEWPCAENIVNTVVFGATCKKPRTYRVFCYLAQKYRYLHGFFDSQVQKIV